MVWQFVHASGGREEFWGCRALAEDLAEDFCGCSCTKVQSKQPAMRRSDPVKRQSHFSDLVKIKSFLVVHLATVLGARLPGNFPEDMFAVRSVLLYFRP